MNKNQTASVSFFKAILVFIFLFSSLLVTIKVYGGSPHIPLAMTAILAGLIAVMSGYKWSFIEEGIKETIKMSSQAIIIMLVIGAIIGTWILGGIVPTMIFYGLKVLSPGIFLIAACLICSVVSLATGSSWSTAGTLGVALMGVGIGLGMPAGMTAGAIISGSYFGDKMSPLSDTTNLAPAMAGANLFDHIKHMVYTTGPSYVITLIIFGVLGLGYADKSIDSSTISIYLDTLSNNFNISLFMLIPPILVIVMVIKKVPALPALVGSTILGCIFAGLFQGATIAEMIASAHYGFSIDTGVDVVNNLLNRGGLNSMMWTVSLILISLTFAGIAEKSGMIHVIVEKILTYAVTDKSLITATLLTTIFTNCATGVQYVALILPGRMFKDVYKERNLHPKNLSRALEDTGTLVAPLVPWSTDAAFLTGALGVSPFVYMPFCFLNIINPIVATVYAQLGFNIVKLDEEVEVSKKTV
jgi:NhaC family Na+:H+ antiporter